MARFKLFTIILIIACSQSAFAHGLQTGDVLLQPLDCWSCSLIEAQEESIYSHIGVYLNIDGEDYVVEAYGSVRLVTLNEFMHKTQKNSSVRVKRYVNSNSIEKETFKKVLLSFVGLPYDRYFLWNNSIDGKEAIYCSELVYKTYIYFAQFSDLSTKVMKFDVNPLLWDRYFRDQTPRGKLGISPADFDTSKDFITMSEIF